ncbi:MAG: hypothetical protein AB8H86_14370 [Polyangiales bacterium]
MRFTMAIALVVGLFGCEEDPVRDWFALSNASEPLQLSRCSEGDCQSSLPGCQPSTLGEDVFRVGDTESLTVADAQSGEGWIASAGGGLRFVREDGTLATFVPVRTGVELRIRAVTAGPGWLGVHQGTGLETRTWFAVEPFAVSWTAFPSPDGRNALVTLGSSLPSGSLVNVLRDDTSAAIRLGPESAGASLDIEVPLEELPTNIDVVFGEQSVSCTDIGLGARLQVTLVDDSEEWVLPSPSPADAGTSPDASVPPSSMSTGVVTVRLETCTTQSCQAVVGQAIGVSARSPRVVEAEVVGERTDRLGEIDLRFRVAADTRSFDVRVLFADVVSDPVRIIVP